MVKIKTWTDRISPVGTFRGHEIAETTDRDGTKLSARGHTKESAVDRLLDKIADKRAEEKSSK